MSETNAIDARHVELTYADGTEAVADLSLEIRAGEFFGFLGANGAGKTTTIKVLATLLKPTGGSVAVNGYDVESEPRAVRESIGYMAQETSIDPELTARENIRFACEAYGVPAADRGERIDDLLELVDLAGVANKVAKDFSGGMKKRLDAATALVHDPPIVFLDEPTTGLDPKARNRLWDYFERINDRGTTVFLTTQYLEEADQLCDRIGVIRDGTIVADGSPAELKDRVGGAVLEIELTDSDAQTRERAREVALEAAVFDDAPIETTDDGLSVRSTAARRRGPELLVALKEAGIPITGFNVRDPTLDDVFLAITGEGLDEDEAATEPGGPGASAAATEVDR
ncbi:ATP-binding cassette domain-containing protein [Haloterrigena sp. SYSU A121-1]|uniref:ATP-binding cassette domain-containing protein n=1 Tax=Haloterrigena gelatinilytica TaxID=2741724 RepID=A0A8J8KGK3_9EURY|nr:ATP-binding cassette domain-containing protein [Haloterrigena gelatinilytica]NUB90119.1 ATP-binding cassette domain-containing protein [Haloterrigena gelatinilytica]